MALRIPEHDAHRVTWLDFHAIRNRCAREAGNDDAPVRPIDEAQLGIHPLATDVERNRRAVAPGMIDGVGLDALVDVEGALRASDGRVLARTTHGYRWVMIPAGVSDVTCSGLCVVAAQGTPVPVPSFASAHRGRGVDFHQILPWLAVAIVPPGASSVLRYNVAYDPHWAAYLVGKRLPHVQLEGIVNGWMLPSRTSPERLVLIHLVSAAQFLAEIFAIVVIATAGIVWLARSIAARLRERQEAS